MDQVRLSWVLVFTNAQGAYWVKCIIGAMQELWDLIYCDKKLQNELRYSTCKILASRIPKSKKTVITQCLFIVYFNESTRLRRKNKDMAKEKRAGKRELKMLQEKKKREIKRKMISPDLLWADSIPKPSRIFCQLLTTHFRFWGIGKYKMLRKE